MKKNLDGNCEKLAELVVNEMEVEELEKFVKDALVERYEKDYEYFKYDLQWHVDEDGEWNE